MLPHLADVVIERVEQAAGGVRVWTRPRAESAACRACGGTSAKVHSRYERRLADAAIGGRPVQIRLRVRRFFCLSEGCQAVTFAEQVEGLTSPYARRTPLLRAMLEPPDAEPQRGQSPSDVDLTQVAADVAAQQAEERSLVIRTRERYAAVHALREQGKGIKTIMRELGLAKETVRRFARAGSVEELLAKPLAGRPSVLDAHKPYLHQRWNEGCHSASQLFREIREHGYAGSRATVADYVRPFRPLGAAPPAAPPPPKVRHIVGWLLRHPDSLDAEERVALKDVRARCPHLDALAGHVTAFAEMLTGRHGHRLDAWIAAAKADDLPDLHRFTTGLKRDHTAVRNGLTLPHSSGPVEGTVNKIKTIKRQMYGRANLDLLRKRVLLAA